MKNGTVDILKRKKFVDSIVEEIEYVKNNHENLFLMIDGEWGSGKTFVLNMVKDEIENDYNVIEYNCWENSFYPDPLIAIISATTEQLNAFSDINKFGIKLMNEFGYIKNIATGTIENKTQIAFGNKNEKPDDKYISLESYVKEFKIKLINFNRDNLGVDNKGIRVIIVDELDRCLPEYAIKVLERLYLLFKNVPDTIVLIGNNNNQLEYSIKSIFGEIEVKEYLKKIIDKTLSLEYQNVNSTKIAEKYKKYFDLFDLENIDDIDECFELISLIIATVNPREHEIKFKKLIQKHKKIFGTDLYGIDLCIYEIVCCFLDFNDMKYIITNNITDLKYTLASNSSNKILDNKGSKELWISLIIALSPLQNANYGHGNVKLGSNSLGMLLYLVVFYYRIRLTSGIVRYYNNCVTTFDDEELKNKLRIMYDEITNH